eukprot:scaffold1624_cov105-Cylindrotheca_fusiformis.AAC.6
MGAGKAFGFAFSRCRVTKRILLIVLEEYFQIGTVFGGIEERCNRITGNVLVQRTLSRWRFHRFVSRGIHAASLASHAV